MSVQGSLYRDLALGQLCSCLREPLRATSRDLGGDASAHLEDITSAAPPTVNRMLEVR